MSHAATLTPHSTFEVESSLSFPARLSKTHEKLHDCHQILLQTITASVLERGERLEQLCKKSANLSMQAQSFNKTSNQVAREIEWRRRRLKIVLTCITIALLIGFVLMLVLVFK